MLNLKLRNKKKLRLETQQDLIERKKLNIIVSEAITQILDEETSTGAPWIFQWLTYQLSITWSRRMKSFMPSTIAKRRQTQGPDGSTVLFFKTSWPISKHDIIVAINSFKPCQFNKVPLAARGCSRWLPRWCRSTRPLWFGRVKWRCYFGLWWRRDKVARGWRPWEVAGGGD